MSVSSIDTCNVYYATTGGGTQGGGLRSTAAKQSYQASGDGAAQKNATIASIASKVGCLLLTLENLLLRGKAGRVY